MKRVLVTGGSGFVGRACLPRLLERGFEVHAISPKPQPNDSPVRWHRCDLHESSNVGELMQSLRPTHLLHLAWCTEPNTFWSSPENRRWLECSLTLFQLFEKAGGRRMVGSGSCAEYDWSAGICHEERTPLSPSTLYGQSKLAAATSLAAMNNARLSTAWARLFFLYGPGASDRRMPGAVISALGRNEPARCSTGTQQRDFLHVSDAADAIVRLLDSELSDAVNVCSGEAVSIRDMAISVAELMGKRDLLQLGALPQSPHEPPLVVGDCSRLRQELNWSPEFTLEQGLLDTVTHWAASHSRLSVASRNGHSH